LGNQEKAMEAYKLCSSLAGSEKENLYIEKKINLCNDTGKFEKARKGYEKYKNGCLLLNKKKWKESINLFKEACACDSSNYLALNNLGVIYTNYLKDYEKGKEYFKKAIKISKQPATEKNLKIIILTEKLNKKQGEIK
jgi:tetratricopeptide (TPR) repeat protein